YLPAPLFFAAWHCCSGVAAARATLAAASSDAAAASIRIVRCRDRMRLSSYGCGCRPVRSPGAARLVPTRPPPCPLPAPPPGARGGRGRGMGGRRGVGWGPPGSGAHGTNEEQGGVEGPFAGRPPAVGELHEPRPGRKVLDAGGRPVRARLRAAARRDRA